jgi:ParB family chromosome partitioning protein
MPEDARPFHFFPVLPATSLWVASRPMAKKTKKKGPEPGSRGLSPRQAGSAPPAAVVALQEAVERDGGTAVGAWRDPLGGKWQVLAVLPIERLEPTPFQRDVSAAHVERLSACIDKLDRFLDPVIAVRREGGVYWTPNGNHRLHAMRALGARAITVLLVPEAEMAYEILALNTEKAHNLRERSLEVIRMARDLAEGDPRIERDCADLFEEPSLLTLGVCYEQRGRFAGSIYHPVLKRIDAFLGAKLPRALEPRAERAAALLALDDAVSEAVVTLKQRGFDSPYLKNFVVARINPLRFQRGKRADFDETLSQMRGAAERFDAGKVKSEHLARSGGAPEE